VAPRVPAKGETEIMLLLLLLLLKLILKPEKGGPLLLYTTQPKPSKSSMDKFSGFHYHSTFCKYGIVLPVLALFIPVRNSPSNVDSGHLEPAV
jgi:hypothetical protein